MSSRGAYAQEARKLVLALDVGTTFSGISYSILDPGQVPSIKGVTKFPAQEQITGASKIPTIIYYDQSGKVRAVGAEAVQEGTYETAEEEKWIKAEWFKLHLRSKENGGPKIDEKIPPIPLGKTVVQVFADFLRYLFDCAARYIKETHANGPTLWASVKDNIEFVLSHPNGWEGKEQSSMREAAVLAGLIPDNPSGQSRISFVTEGEASLHCAVDNGVLDETKIKGEGVVIVDAGGGTVDVSSYARTEDDTGSSSFEEIAAAQCHFYGSIFVTVSAKTFLEGALLLFWPSSYLLSNGILEFLVNSPFLEDLEHIVGCFDKLTKPRFRNVDDCQFIKFGSARDNDASCGIRFGQLKLSGADVATFFDPSVQCIIEAVLSQQSSCGGKLTHVVLVGGFAASDYLFDKVDATLSKRGLTVVRPESYVNKAVSDGAVAFYLDRSVRARISKIVYGAFASIPLDYNDQDHMKRVATKYIEAQSGVERLLDFFIVILPKGTKVSETQEFRRTFNRITYATSTLSACENHVWCYKGPSSNPRWKDEDTENFKHICSIQADLSDLPSNSRINIRGETYHTVHYEIVMLFGLTELKAQVAWKAKDGTERRTAAAIIYH